MHNDPPSNIVSDPAYVASVRSLYQKMVREWIMVSLSHAPCTTQGLLQVNFSVSCEPYLLIAFLVYSSSANRFAKLIAKNMNLIFELTEVRVFLMFVFSLCLFDG